MQARRKPKVAKGARDFLPDQMAIREVKFGVSLNEHEVYFPRQVASCLFLSLKTGLTDH